MSTMLVKHFFCKECIFINKSFIIDSPFDLKWRAEKESGGNLTSVVVDLLITTPSKMSVTGCNTNGTNLRIKRRSGKQACSLNLAFVNSNCHLLD